MYFILKSLLSGLAVGLITLAADKSPRIGALEASLMATSILALILLHHEGISRTELVQLSNSIAIIVIPFLLFFVAFSFLQKKDIGFYLSVGGAVFL